MSVFLLINGPNLNLLGSRERGVYGATRLEDIEARCVAGCFSRGAESVYRNTPEQYLCAGGIQAKQ